MKNRVFYRILAGAVFAAAIILMFVLIGVEQKNKYDYPGNPTGITLCINEVLYSNLGFIRDEDGDRSDWIELYNYGDDSVSLKGLSLADHRGEKSRWYFPDVSLEGGDYLLVWASGKDKVTDSGELHTDFLIGSTDRITLYDENNDCIDELYFDGSVDTGVSVGRVRNNPSELALLAVNTPGKANDAQKISLVTRIDDTLGEPQFSAEAGIYDKDFELTLKAGEGETILYTLDGTEPTFNSYVYDGPIVIRDRSGEPNLIGDVATTTGYTMKYEWENDYTYKGTVVKARIMKNGALSGRTVTRSYFIAPKTTFNIVSLTVDPREMFDEWKGLYVPGETYYVWKKYNKENYNPFPPGNYDSEDNVKSHIEIFSHEGAVLADNDAEVSIMGGASRSNPAKGLKVTMDENKKSFSGEMFELLPVSDDASGEGLDTLVLRAGGTDFNRTMFSDALAQSLVADRMDVTTQAAQPAVLFINGEYWGIHNIREAYNADYFYRHYGIEEKNLALIKLNTGLAPYTPEISVGHESDLQDYLDLVEYVTTHDLSDPACYEYVCDRIDADAYMDYYIAEMYLGNDDWPGNNYRIYRADQPGADKGDNKWRPVLFDVDDAFRYPDFNTVDFILNKEYDEKSVKNVGLHYEGNREIIEALIQNEEFRTRFFDRFEECLDTVFSEETVLASIEEYQELYAPEMRDHFSRWHTVDGWLKKIKLLFRRGYSEEGMYSYESWEHNLEKFKSFAEERPGKLREYIDQYNS